MCILITPIQVCCYLLHTAPAPAPAPPRCCRLFCLIFILHLRTERLLQSFPVHVLFIIRRSIMFMMMPELKAARHNSISSTSTRKMRVNIRPLHIIVLELLHKICAQHPMHRLSAVWNIYLNYNHSARKGNSHFKFPPFCGY